MKNNECHYFCMLNAQGKRITSAVGFNRKKAIESYHILKVQPYWFPTTTWLDTGEGTEVIVSDNQLKTCNIL